MMTYTPSYAIDALASGNAPGVTIYPKLATGSPETILTHVTEMLQKAQQFAQLIEEFSKAEKQLVDAWSGHAADSAVKKIEDSLKAFTEIVQVIQRGAALLQSSAALITTAQTGYTAVVGAVNPTVAGLMSNPYTYAAAQALATVTAASLSAFVNAISGLLKALGAVKIAGELATVAQIITLLDQLFGNKTTTPVNSGAVSGNTVTPPTTPGSAASGTGTQAISASGQADQQAAQAAAQQSAAASGAQTGQTLTGAESTLQQNSQLLHTADGAEYSADGKQLFTANGQPAYMNYTPPALSGLVGANPSGLPTTLPAGNPPTDSWNAVDPTHPGVGAPATPAAPGGVGGVGGAGATPVGDAPGAGGTTDPGTTTPGATDPGTTAPGTTDPGTSGDEIRVTTTHGDTTTVVEVPIDGHNEVTITADGTITVDAEPTVTVA